jgi:DNA-binding Lrp family transcriptional regulator
MERLDDIDERILAELAEHARATFAEIGARVDIPEVVSAATVTGACDAILHVLARDMHHLEEALERIRTSADIERTESTVVLSNLIERYRAETAESTSSHG